MPNYCDKCGEGINPDDVFCNNCGSQLTASKTRSDARATAKRPEMAPVSEPRPYTSTRPKRFYRSVEDKWIAGICGGLGEYFNIDPILVRIGFIILFLGGGTGLFLYIIMWIFVKENPTQRPRSYQYGQNP